MLAVLLIGVCFLVAYLVTGSAYERLDGRGRQGLLMRVEAYDPPMLRRPRSSVAAFAGILTSVCPAAARGEVPVLEGEFL